MTQSDDVQRLLDAFIDAQRAVGAVDPGPYLEKLEGADRRELAALIDAYLQRAPRAAWDPDAFAGSPAEAVAGALERSLLGESGGWPALLPSLRSTRRLRRQEVVERLAASLGAEDRTEKVAAYYHEMERGLLPAEGVSERVLEALAGILDAPADWLRAAGRAFRGPGSAAGEEPVFARTARPRAGYEVEESEAERAPEREWDEIDELFRGG